jgi:teichuronic acid biosynthesis glycosyltransferase TuaC
MDNHLKILFVSSGNHVTGISPIVKNQGESLRRMGIDVIYFTISGKGFYGYFKSIFKLKQVIRLEKPDLLHGHYSLSCFVSLFASRKPVVASLMGSDTEISFLMKIMIRMAAKYFWKITIVKSKSMKVRIGIDNVHVIPNGVDFTRFVPLDQLECKMMVGFDKAKKQVLFMANPARYEKNYELALKAFEVVKLGFNSEIELKVVYNIPHENVPQYLNAADIVLMSSRWEGSPNIIKEAMACNIPIVSTKVGDVEEIIGFTSGCFLAESDVKELSGKIKLALEFNGRTQGRTRIAHLSNELIAERIINIYQKSLQ